MKRRDLSRLRPKDGYPSAFCGCSVVAEGAPGIHDKGPEARIHNAQRNIVAEVHGGTGDIDAGFAEADAIHEGTYYVPRVQHAHLETHGAVGWLDEAVELIAAGTDINYQGASGEVEFDEHFDQPAHSEPYVLDVGSISLP